MELLGDDVSKHSFIPVYVISELYFTVWPCFVHEMLMNKKRCNILVSLILIIMYNNFELMRYVTWSVHTTTALLEMWHWECASHPSYCPSLMSLDFHMSYEFRKHFKVSDFHLIALWKCMSRSWEQDISYCQGLENLIVCYDKCLN